MADLPNPKSQEQLISEMLASYAFKMRINDFNVGSAVTSFFEVVALTVARSSGDVFQILRDFSVDRASGDALKRLAIENNVPLITAKVSTGTVTVKDVSFDKISTKIYAGANSPNIGSVQIKVSDASTFPSSGSIYIGRGTPNIEGPIPYTVVAAVGGYWTIDLSAPTTKFHNKGESVILAQGGNRFVPQNTIVVSPSFGASPDIDFLVTASAIILDGEIEVTGVKISAKEPGTDGNVPRAAIKQFASPPFSGATVTNELPLTTGRDSEQDDELKVRIKRQLASKGLATATAIKAAIIGASPTDEQSSILISAEIIKDSFGSIVFIDDGNGYEAKSNGVGLESIVDSALGGEQIFQLTTGGRQAPVEKAFLQSIFEAPFDIKGGDTLAITVGEQTYQHVFADSDFRSPGGVTAFEVTASVNANTDIGFEATTAGGGQFVVFRAKNEGNDSLQVATPTTNGRNASVLLGLSFNKIETLRLYKNKIPLSKDGATASLFTQTQALWSPSIVSGDTLILSVDGTDFITYTITDGDFIAAGLYNTVNSTNSLESWVAVFNNKLTGVTVSIVGQQLKVTSNLGASSRAKVIIDSSSSFVTKGMFTSNLGLSSSGKTSDYTLFRNLAQFKLAGPLEAGDELTSGSLNTEAMIESSQIPGGSVTLTSDAHVWLLIDNNGEIIRTGLVPNSSLSVSKPSTNIVRYGSSVSTAFSNVNVGDYVIIWSDELDANDRLEGRVRAKTNNTIDILVTSAEWSSIVTTTGETFFDGFVVLRSSKAPQKFRVTSGTKTLETIAEELQDQSVSLDFSVSQDQFLVINTKTKDSDGQILVVSADSQGKLLNLPLGKSDSSKQSLVAFYDSQSFDAELPLFIHSLFASGTAADPIDSFISSIVSDVSLSSRDPNELICLLHPYGGIDDAQAAGERFQESAISGSTITVDNNDYVRRVRTDDRYFIANPLDFGHQDTAVVALDNDTSTKSFELPFYRKAVTNTGFASNPFSFNAYDVESGPATNFSSMFGATFDFSNFKVLMQAKKVLKATGVSQTAVLYRAKSWGRSGEKINVGYIYPSSPNSSIGSVIEINPDIDIRINLKSGAIVPSSIDASTEWNVTVTANNPVAGVDQVTYTWNGTGTNPALGLVGGEYVNITSQSEFSEANTGVFRVSTAGGFTPTSTSFSVQRPTGIAVAESNKATIVSSAISFYDKSNTTANDIVTYVNANLSNYFSAVLTNDGGTGGTGVLEFSTFEDTSFVSRSVYLKDGINWIASNSLLALPQFTFKKALDLPTDTGYAFNSSEEIRFVPTTMDQVKRLLSVLAVTGFTTVGTIDLSERSSKLELATDILGSNGAVQIIGGLANKYEVPVLDSAIRLNNQDMLISTDAVSASGVHSDQWFRLEAEILQRKEALLSSNSSITVLSNDPTLGEATVKLSGRAYNQRYFGNPRNHTRIRGRKFRVEKQGSLVCLSWDGSGTSPVFEKSANFNASGGGTLNVDIISGTSEADYVILTGNANFNELSIGDLITFSGLLKTENNGTFLVTGVSSDGRTVRVLNSDAVNEFSHGSFTLNTNLYTGDQVVIGANTLVADTDFAVGATADDTAANLAAVAGTLAGITTSAINNVITITSIAVNSTFILSFTGSGSVTVVQMAGDSYTGSTFTSSISVSEGDTVFIASPFSVLNQGKFRVIRRYNDSIWFENPDVVEEEVLLPSNYISLGFDGTTSFKVIATNRSTYLTWNGSGTEPNLQNAFVGDVVNFGNDFNVNNQGEHMVLRSGEKLQEISQFQLPTGLQFTASGAGQYFLVNSAGDMNQYYVWFNVNGGNTDPAVFGKTGIEVDILSGDTAAQVAAKAALVVNVATGLSAVSVGSLLTVTTTGYQETTHASNFNVPAPFVVDILQAGRRTFLECVNPSAVNESSVLITNVLTCNRPQILFYEYEATVAGDSFVVTGDILGSSNAGTYTVKQVLDRDRAIITGNLADVSNVSLNGRETSVYVQEGIKYTGYKQATFAISQIGAPSRISVMFNTNNQYEKINEASSVSLVSLSKMNFETSVRKGLDSYRYNTGLIAEANRIIYGDPRDESTYSGVGAAGADIFVRESLAKRIQVGIDVRIATGVPFAQIAEQIRTSVSSLINSNPVGQSIAISSIVSIVNAIPGTRAVAISSPQYDSTHDIIKLAPSEKARIIDPVTDIFVSQNN